MDYTKVPCYDKGDWILRASLYAAGQLMSGEKTDYIHGTMIKYCRLNKWLGHRKCPEYRWSNSGSQNPAENTLFRRPTYWIYNNILKRFGIDPYKGANHDQYRAHFLTLYINKDWVGALKVMFGYFIRLGFAPSWMEHCLFKPQAFVLLLNMPFPFKLHYLWKPVAWVSRKIFNWRAKRELMIPNSESTTNKITMLPTMKLLGMEMPSDDYIREVYDTYFAHDNESYKLIKSSIKKGLGV